MNRRKEIVKTIEKRKQALIDIGHHKNEIRAITEAKNDIDAKLATLLKYEFGGKPVLIDGLIYSIDSVGSLVVTQSDIVVIDTRDATNEP